MPLGIEAARSRLRGGTALFYPITDMPLAPQHGHLQAYFDRLMDHGPVARIVDEARPFL